jgi:hypothetical protein
VNAALKRQSETGINFGVSAAGTINISASPQENKPIACVVEIDKQ